MKKIIVFLLAALLMFSVVFADSVPMSKEDQMANLVKNFLEENEFPYEYDDYIFTVPFSVDNSISPARTSCSTCSPCRTAIWKTTATASWRY